MLEKIYLHIGTGKAGSSSIQLFLNRNRECLRALSYLVPQVCGPRRHFNLKHIATDAEDTQRYYRQAKVSAELQFATAAAFTKALRAEIKAEAPRHLILTDESLALSIPEAGIGNLAAFCNRLARRTQVICYVRRQDLALMSHFQQSVRYGKAHTLEKYLEGAVGRFDYHARLSVWANIFGREHLSVVPFETESFFRGDLIEDFASHLGVADNTSLEKNIPIKNPSLGATQLELLARIAQNFPRRYGEPGSAARRTILRAVRENPDPAKPSLPIALAREILTRFEESNRLLAVDFAGRLDGTMFRSALVERHPAFGEALTTDATVAILVSHIQRHFDANGKWRGRSDASPPAQDGAVQLISPPPTNSDETKTAATCTVPQARSPTVLPRLLAFWHKMKHTHANH